MAAMDEIAILLQGRNAEADRHRAWRVEAGRDLFGKWMVRVSFGRIGCRGRTFAREFASKRIHRGTLTRDVLKRAYCRGAPSGSRPSASRAARMVGFVLMAGDLEQPTNRLESV